MDITDIGGAGVKAQKAKSGLPNKAQFVPAEKYQQEVGDEFVPQNPKAEAFRKSHWTIDKHVQDGQISAGEVDQDHEEFLKNTEMID